MKAITLLLLLANLAVAGYFLGREQWAKPAPQGVPLHVDRLSLRGHSAGAAGAVSAAPQPAITCIEWRGLTVDEFSGVREALKQMAGARVMSFSEVPVDTRHWVLFPPLPSAESAKAKFDELVASGLDDAYVVEDEPWRNAISLGLFATADGAQRRVIEVEEKGVHGTRIETVPRRGTDYYFVIRSEDPEALKNLGVIKQAYPSSQQSRVACPP